MPSKEKLSELVTWVRNHITGDEKEQAQIYLDRLIQAFGQAGCLDVGGTTEFRIRKDKEDGGGTAFADYVWKPTELPERWGPLAFLADCFKLLVKRGVPANYPDAKKLVTEDCITPLANP